MLRSVVPAAVALALVILLVSDGHAQRAGQSVTVRTGTVTGMRSVDLNDGNAIKGALVGGAFGAALTSSSKKSGRRDKNAAIGAVLGGAVAASKTRPGRVYTVTTNDGTMIQIATEQTEIRVDDCVYVEQGATTANIRRAPGAACLPASQSVMQDAAIVEELQEDATACMVAKQELVDAESDEAIERAVRKVQILCYD